MIRASLESNLRQQRLLQVNRLHMVAFQAIDLRQIVRRFLQRISILGEMLLTERHVRPMDAQSILELTGGRQSIRQDT